MGIRVDARELGRLGSWGAARATSFFEEFRAFALKGNVIDLAIGVIIGSAFSKVIDSLVKNILMPLISLLLPTNEGYLGWKVTIDGKEIPYGLFLGDVLNFVIVALALFLFVKKFLGLVARWREHQVAAAAAAPPPPSPEVTLLTEIRDELRQSRIPPG